MSESIIVARPEGQAEQLMLLFHGVGTTAHDMVPLGRLLAAEFPAAFIVSVNAPIATGPSAGQWFSVLDITEENRPERVEAALPAFIHAVHHWQGQAGVATDAVALIGFSQGGIMALEATRDQAPLAGRVISIAGRFAKLPEAANEGTTLHLFHGKLDPVIPYGFTVEAAQHLVKIGADVTADVIPFVGHQINDDIVALMIERLRGHLPKRTWEAALKAAKATASREE
ncbi:MAG: esterase [Betaproteobacteria bacterium]